MKTTTKTERPATGTAIDVRNDINFQWFTGYVVVAHHGGGFSYERPEIGIWSFMGDDQQGAWRVTDAGKAVA